jgi:hypothetical protein
LHLIPTWRSGSTYRTRYTEDGLLKRIEREIAAGTREQVYEAEDFGHLGQPRRVRQGDAVRTAFILHLRRDHGAPATPAEDGEPA